MQLKNGPASAWTSNNITLAKGEIGIEIDTNKMKIGDGINSWKLLQYIYVDKHPIGHVQYQYVVESGYLKLDGSTVSRTTYADLWSWAQANSLTTSDNTSNTTKHLFGTGDGSTTFVLPNFVDLSLQGGSAIGSIGAGLPNITGSLNLDVYGAGKLHVADSVGAISGKENATISPVGSSGADVSGMATGISINASKSSSIYGASTTVQPPAVKLIPQIKY